MDPNLSTNWPYFDNIITEEEIFDTLNFYGIGGESDQDMPHDQGCQLISSGSVLDIRNNSQATHQLVDGSSSLASGPQPAETDILCPNVKGRTYHMKYTPQDVENLINGVEKHKRRIDWKSIKKLDYFNNTPRTKDQLKYKWRHMVQSADTEADPILKELYMRAKNIEADRSSKKGKDTFSLQKLPKIISHDRLKQKRKEYRE